MFSKLAGQIHKMTYYCEYNHCKVVSREILKQLGPIRQKVDENTQRIVSLEDKVNKQGEALEKAVTDEVARCLDDTIDERVKSV